MCRASEAATRPLRPPPALSQRTCHGSRVRGANEPFAHLRRALDARVPPVGFEPTISGLKVRCLASLATGAIRLSQFEARARRAGRAGGAPCTEHESRRSR